MNSSNLTMKPYFSILLFLLYFNHVNSFNILVIFSLPLRSHYIAVKPLFDELATRGHNVTVINNFPEHKPVNNLRYVNVQSVNSSGDSAYFSPLTYYGNLDSRLYTIVNYYKHFTIVPGAVSQDCMNLLTNENVKVLQEKKEKFDVIFVEQFMSDCGLVYAAEYYQAPIIGITSHVLLPWTYSRLGLPFDYTTDAFYFSNAGTNPSLIKQVEIVVLDTLFNTLRKWIIHRNLYKEYLKNFPEYKIDVEEIAKERMKMVFSYQHFSLTGGRILAPQLLEIGGVHIGKSKPLSKELNDFITSSEHGVIYMSFGSNLKMSTMSEKKLNTILNVAERIPQKIIIKWENNALLLNTSKMLAAAWLPQLDILCHPNVVGFVSHGGMLGTSEAVHCGVPVLVMPFFGDQLANAASIKEAGIGSILYFPDMDEENLYGGLKDILSDKVQKRAKEVSKLWHDRPLSVMDSAIYWTEYVARHGTSPPPLPTKHTTLWQHLLLDGVLIIILFINLYFVYIVLKLVIDLLKLLLGLICKIKPKQE